MQCSVVVVSSLLATLHCNSLDLKYGSLTMTKNVIKVGVTGFVHGYADKVQIWNAVSRGLQQIKKDTNADELLVISGLTDQGVPQAAYYIARQNGWNIGGIAPACALNQKIFPLNEDGDIGRIVGRRWGDECEAFVDECDHLLLVGGGKQALDMVEIAKRDDIPVHESHPRRQFFNNKK